MLYNINMNMNMNTTKLILIIVLVYISYQQKKNADRNMMLIMTGLLGLCMLLSKVEGYCTIPASELNPNFPRNALINQEGNPVDWDGSGNLITNDNLKFNEDSFPRCTRNLDPTQVCTIEEGGGCPD